MWQQKTITLKPKPRGFHLVTSEVESLLPEITSYRIGLVNLFIQHTSASLTINENCDPLVRDDLEAYLNYSIPETLPFLKHTYEGPDDMPAHIKTVLIGPSLNIPISQGSLALGTWQGIYLGEHRNHGGARKIVVTIQGELF
jgi:secondary thiamine-phosphate synthase enzyme